MPIPPWYLSTYVGNMFFPIQIIANDYPKELSFIDVIDSFSIIWSRNSFLKMVFFENTIKWEKTRYMVFPKTFEWARD